MDMNQARSAASDVGLVGRCCEPHGALLDCFCFRELAEIMKSMQVHMVCPDATACS